MKSLICSIILILSFAYGQAQLYPVTQSVGNTPTTKVKTNALEGKLILTTFTDTTAANTEGYLKNYDGALIKTTTPINAVWYRVLDSAKWVQILPQGGGTPVSGQAWVVGGNNNLFTDGNNNATFGTNQTNGIYVKTDGVTRLYLDKYGIAPETINSVGLGYDPTDSNRITLFSGSGGSGWSLTGNAGTDSGTNFIGTTDYMPLMFRVNNTRFGVIDPTSSLGFGSNVLLVNEGTGNVALGTNVLSKNTTGLGNVAIGTNASRFNITGLRNIALGQSALDSSTAGSTNIAIGYRAANRYNSDNIIAIGTEALSSSTVAGVGIGTNALRYNTGTFNVGVGNSVLASATSTGGFNTAVGNNALSVNTTGTGHVAIGASALIANTTGDKNTAVGSGALEANIGGSQNTSVGQDNQYQATSGNLNTSIGYEGMNNRSTGTGNTASGYRGGGSLTTGSYNSFFGYQSGSNASQKVDASRSGAFGTDSYTDCDTCISIGAPYNLKTILYGDTIRMPDLPTAVGVYSVRADANGNLSLADTTAGGDGIYGGSGTLPSNVTVTGSGNSIDFNGTNNFTVNSDEGGDGSSFFQVGASGATLFTNYNSLTGGESSLRFDGDSIVIRPPFGLLYVDSLTNNVGTKSMRYNPTTGLVSYADTTTGGSGANAALSNLASVAINTSLLPATDNAIDLGSPTKQWRDLYMTGASLYMDGVKTLQATGLTMPTGAGLKTRTSSGNTLLLQAYDVDGAAYTTFGTLTAGNTPTLDFNVATTFGSKTVNTLISDSITSNEVVFRNPESGDTLFVEEATNEYLIKSIVRGYGIKNTAVNDTTVVLEADTSILVNKSGYQKLENKRWTARVGSTTSSATPTINTDSVDIYKLTAQTADITSFTTNLTGTPVDGDILEIQVTGTAARALTFGSSFVSSTVTIPTTTVTTTTLTIIFQWYTTSSYGNNKWVCVNSY